MTRVALALVLAGCAGPVAVAADVDPDVMAAVADWQAVGELVVSDPDGIPVVLDDSADCRRLPQQHPGWGSYHPVWALSADDHVQITICVGRMAALGVPRDCVRTIAAHEIGHALGRPEEPDGIMSPTCPCGTRP